ncbi:MULTISPECIES: hypothetical protein [Halolamina]|uniref:DUF1648 domain-containing protein n=1 Tax=Halolamina pelagica TaxID=699431 RepID=A0A1I5MPE1_9EURY|nr:MULTISPECIES: hypothetical protein [Halolamina]NHX36107.1 hypothetical protein [Halolamina sp. R1-12]SFP11419.1 hypothetical protein SAMN05216277_101351 [Halolamina pelagica]
MRLARRALPELSSFALVVATVAAGVVVAPALPEWMIVGWHVGLDGEATVTRGPRLVGLVAVPAVTATLYVVLRVTRLALDEGYGVDTRPFEALAHLVLAALAFGQGWLLAVNL